MSAIDDLDTIFKGELKANDLNSLKKAFASFITGDEEETKAAEAIANNVKDSLKSYMDGDLSKSDLKFILQNAQDGYKALVDAKVLRLKKAALNTFFSVVKTWLLTLI